MEKNRSIFFNIDWLTVILYVALVAIGLMSIYAANYDPAHVSIFDMQKNYGKQAVWIITAFTMACVILLLDSKFFPTFSYGFYALTMIMVVGVMFFGRSVMGNRNWFEIGSFRLQPSEFAKVTTCLALARFLSGTNIKWQDLNTRLIAFAIVGIPFLLVGLGDVGSSLTFSAFIFVLFREGLPPWVLLVTLLGITLFVTSLLVKSVYLFGAILLAAGFIFYYMRKTQKNLTLVIVGAVLSSALIFAVPFFINNVLKPHQRVRVNNLVGKDIDLKGNYYNVNQSQIAIGSGRMFGKGFLQGTQTKFDFVPEQTTDFIFCTVGEEWGFAGALFVIGLYVAMLMRIITLAERQRTIFGRVYGYGAACIIFFHITINIGMTIGLVPVIGIPLPFISYGGSSLWSFTILLFILVKQDAARTMLR